MAELVETVARAIEADLEAAAGSVHPAMLARAAIRAVLEELIAETYTDIDPTLIADFAKRHGIALDG